MLLKACHKDRRQRYPSADAMRADLQLLQRGQSVQRKHAAERRFAFARRILAPSGNRRFAGRRLLVLVHFLATAKL